MSHFESTNRILLRLGLASLLGLIGSWGISSSYAKTLLDYQRSESNPTNSIPITPQANQSPVYIDTKVQLSSHEQSATIQTAEPPVEDIRVLAPPSAPVSRKTQGPSLRKSLTEGFPTESLTTVGVGLAIVMGMFLVCMWLMQRGGPKPHSALPLEAVAVLGKMSLANRSVAQLIQIGNKLVLVAMTPDGVSPITEVTDPNEVARLLGICLRNQKQSSSAEFQQVLQKLSQESTHGFLGREANATYSQVNRK